MGPFTEFYINTDLKKDTPEDVINILLAMCYPAVNEDQHCLKGVPGRWAYMFHSKSYYFPYVTCAKLTSDKVRGGYSLLAKGNIKNYKNEIEQFFDFVKPWCENDFIGYHRYEEYREPTLVYSGYPEN